MPQLIAFLRTLAAAGRSRRAAGADEASRLTDGKSLDGVVLNQGFDDLQLRTDDDRVHLLRRSGRRVSARSRRRRTGRGITAIRGGNRYTTLSEITPANVSRLAPKWVFTLPNAARLQLTPVVVGGLMYVTCGQRVLRAGRGHGPAGLAFPAARRRPARARRVGGTNRGVAVAGDRVFMETDNAHIIALNRFTGKLVWDTEMADWRQSYFATSAPLAVGNLVVAGVGGGEHGTRGFLAAYDQATGKEAWRFWTVPKPGEPGSETWQGKGIEHGGAPTWFTGTYDPALDTVYWPTGNPARRVLRRRSQGRQPLFGLHPGARRRRPASSSGITSSLRTICGTGTRPRRPC